MGVHIRWVDFTGLYITLPTYVAGMVEQPTRCSISFCCLAWLWYVGKLFVQSHAHMIGKDGARAERYPKRYLNDTKNCPKAPRLTSWSQIRMLVVCRSDGLKFCALVGYILINSCEWPKHAKKQFSFQKSGWLEKPPEQRKGGTTWETTKTTSVSQ